MGPSKKLTPIFLKLFHKIQTEEVFSNTYLKVNIILVTKSPYYFDKDPTKENCGPMSLLNMDVSILNKMLAN